MSLSKVDNEFSFWGGHAERRPCFLARGKCRLASLAAGTVFCLRGSRRGGGFCARLLSWNPGTLPQWPRILFGVVGVSEALKAARRTGR